MILLGMLKDILANVNMMKRRLEEPNTFSMSSMNSTKRLKLVEMYNIKTATQLVSFNELSTIGFEPEQFVWDNSHMEDWHSRAYTDYICTNFLGLEYLKNHVVLNISQNKSYFDAPHLHGTADVIVHTKTIDMLRKCAIELVVEVKKVNTCL